jgi:hypothetical protein
MQESANGDLDGAMRMASGLDAESGCICRANSDNRQSG